MLTIFFIVVASVFSFLGVELAVQTQKHITLHQLLHPSYYENDFPEKDFPCRKKKRASYQQQVSRGYEHMKQEKIVICCLGRNIAHNLESFRKRLEATGNLFKDYTVLIFENDSSDGSRQLLKDWSATNKHVQVLELENNKDCVLNLPEMYSYGSTSPTRIQKMSCFRNYYLDVVKKNFSHYKYMLVIDMDIKGPWSHDGIAHTMAQTDWDAVAGYGLINLFGTAGQVLVMYDVLAYVPYGEEFNPDTGVMTVGANMFKYNFIDLRKVKRGDDLIQVRSAFGGMTFYKIASIMDAEYVPTRCEHIGLHDTMAAHGHGKIFMNPNLIILAGLQGPPNPFAEISIFSKKPAPAQQTA